jgi:hypothetical protein
MFSNRAEMVNIPRLNTARPVPLKDPWRTVIPIISVNDNSNDCRANVPDDKYDLTLFITAADETAPIRQIHTV